MSTYEASPLPLTLGQQFAAARKKTGHDQTSLGAILGCDRTTISRWERDQSEPPFSAVSRLSDMSGWPLELFARAQSPMAPPPPDRGSVIGESSSACTRLAQVIAFPSPPADLADVA